MVLQYAPQTMFDRPFGRGRWPLYALILSSCLSACGVFGDPADPSSLAQPPEYEPPGGQSKCKLTASQLRPLIVEWSASDRAALEVLAKRGTVVVRYSDCEMEILPRCRAPGAYRYVPTSRKTEQVIIQDEDELYASLPTGAFKLEGKLRRAGQLNVNLNVVGQYDSDQTTIPSDALEGNCAKATHVVTGLTVGAFEFSAGASGEAGGGASALGSGVGASASRRREVLSSDGNVAACMNATRTDAEPPDHCAALVRIAVAKLSGPVAPPPPATSCPEGLLRIGGACVEPRGMGGIAVAQASRLLVRVSCGLGFNQDLLGESDGLRVWIDGEPAPVAEEQRAFNALAPGAPGLLQYVAYETTPGKHRVRIEADGCEPMENEIVVKPGAPRNVGGRLRPTHWSRRPPAASMGVGLGVNYHLFQFDSLELEDDSYNAVSLSPDTTRGFGVEVPFYAGNTWGSMGFSWTKGDLPIKAPPCTGSLAEDCLAAGTEVEGSISGYHIPFLVAGRLPFVYGAALLGSGFEMNIVSSDVAEAEPNFGYTSSGLGLHVPVWAGIEMRPTCGLGFTVRAAHGFGLTSAVGSYNAVTASLALYAASGCSSEDYGIQ